VQLGKRLIFVLLVVYAGLVVFQAWVADDAYITFRVLDNFFEGLGLRWNAGERVQVFTHPLWAALVGVAAAPTGEFYFTSIGVSVACSVAAVSILVFGLARDSRGALVVLAPILFSRAFTHFSTSGLENPLTHLLLAVFFVLFLRGGREPRDVFWLTLAATGLVLNRMDSGLIVLPALVLRLAEQMSPRTVGAVVLAGLPVVAWEIFSMIYYGFPFPNTAYAKLGSGVPASDLLVQGGHYVVDSLSRDPVTGVTVLVALCSALWRPDRARLVIALGILLELAYILRIGGDFMSGRFFTAVFFTSTVLLVRLPRANGVMIAAAWVGVVALALLGNPKESLRSHGIVDERSFYKPYTHLVPILRGETRVEDHRWALRGFEARSAGVTHGGTPAVGIAGFYSGPSVHVVDYVGLADPLLARLPVNPGPWRIGHFERMRPPGYVATLRVGENRIEHPQLAEYYDSLVLVTQGPLFTLERFKAIGRLNSSWGSERIEAFALDNASTPGEGETMRAP